MTKARLFHLAVVTALVVCALITAFSILPAGMHDGAD
jgi:hypothetical protein